MLKTSFRYKPFLTRHLFGRLFSDISLDTVLSRMGCEKSDAVTGAVIPPIHLSTNFERDKHGKLSTGYDYSRCSNPTRKLLENAFTELESGMEAYACSSGMQAASILLLSCPNAHVILPDDLYHGVKELTRHILAPWGLTHESVDMTNQELVVASLLRSLKLKRRVILWLETPSNPLCKVTDVKWLCAEVKNLNNRRDKSSDEPDIVVVVDSTWCTPFLSRPLLLGADFVLHSMTKYIGGHSDILGGILIAGKSDITKSLVPNIRLCHQIGGGVANPMDCYMSLRGLRTLHVRMKQHCTNAKHLADFLSDHPCVELVHYPGLSSHPQHKIATELMGGIYYGGMLSIRVRTNKSTSGASETALAVLAHVNLLKRATSLGGTESLIEHRRSVDGTSPENLLRISVGLEDVNDLMHDIDAALRAAVL